MMNHSPHYFNFKDCMVNGWWIWMMNGCWMDVITYVIEFISYPIHRYSKFIYDFRFFSAVRRTAHSIFVSFSEGWYDWILPKLADVRGYWPLQHPSIWAPHTRTSCSTHSPIPYIIKLISPNIYQQPIVSDIWFHCKWLCRSYFCYTNHEARVFFYPFISHTIKHVQQTKERPYHHNDCRSFDRVSQKVKNAS